MKHFLRFLALIFLSISTQASAQFSPGTVEVGVYSAYQFTYFKSNKIEYSGDYDQGNYRTSGYTIGGLIEYYIYPKLALTGCIRFENVQVSNIITQQKYKLTLDSDTTNILSNSYSIRAPQILVSILAKKFISNSKFSFLSGINIGLLFADKQEERMYINKPTIKFPDLDSLSGLRSSKGYTPHFTDESRTSITTYSGPIYQHNILQLGLTAGLQYDLPIYTLDETSQKFVTLTPTVLFNYNLTTYSDYEKLRAWNVSAGMALKVGL